jgi:AmmeMemoRadiSam system protein B
MKVRKPCQAGAFYPGTKDSLIKSLEDCFQNLGPCRKPSVNFEGRRKIKGVVCPHAGYIYSGPIAAYSYLALAEDGKPDFAVIIGPNHTGVGSGVSIMVDGVWETPLGKLEIDKETAENIFSFTNIIDINETAHEYEHSIEVQIPFLQYLYGEEIKIIPICMMMQDLETAIEVGDSIFKGIKDSNYVVIASTDMTHYEPQVEAEKKDKEVIDSIINLDEKRLNRAIREKNVSMCGYGPTIAFIKIMKLIGAVNVKLLKYGTSGDVTGDTSSIVGYASIAAST